MFKSGIVVSLEGNKVILMDNTFSYYRVYVKGTPPKLGEIYEGEVVKKHHIFKYLKVAIIAFFILSGAYTAKAYYTTSAEITIKINPSLKLYVNSFNRVYKYSGLNKDGTNLTKYLKLSNMKIDDALSEIYHKAKEHKYLNDKYVNGSKEISIDIKSEKKKEIDIKKFEGELKKDKINFKVDVDGKETLKSNPYKTVNNVPENTGAVHNKDNSNNEDKNKATAPQNNNSNVPKENTNNSNKTPENPVKQDNKNNENSKKEDANKEKSKVQKTEEKSSNNSTEKNNVEKGKENKNHK